MASLGKQLYEVKYQCQSCHTIGSAGGYVGPNLTNVGNWINAAWIEEWLKNPQSLAPEAIEPHRDFTDEERTALTAYLMTLKQSAPAQPAERPGGANETEATHRARGRSGCWFGHFLPREPGCGETRSPRAGLRQRSRIGTILRM